MYCHSIPEGASYVYPAEVAAPGFMCVCVFPDSSILTAQGLLYLGDGAKLLTVTIQKLRIGLISGQGGPGGWMQNLPNLLKTLVITGELRWHIHAIDAGVGTDGTGSHGPFLGGGGQQC